MNYLIKSVFFMLMLTSVAFSQSSIKGKVVDLQTNIGWGDLSHKGKNQYLMPYKTKEKLFTESGLQIDNHLKQEWAYVGYLGIGAGVYYRYGAYRNPEPKDNIAFKLTTTFTIK